MWQNLARPRLISLWLLPPDDGQGQDGQTMPSNIARAILGNFRRMSSFKYKRAKRLHLNRDVMISAANKIIPLKPGSLNVFTRAMFFAALERSTSLSAGKYDKDMRGERWTFGFNIFGRLTTLSPILGGTPRSRGKPVDHEEAGGESRRRISIQGRLPIWITEYF